jgi:glycosyltransferase involved in cell wall biosynthesis
MRKGLCHLLLEDRNLNISVVIPFYNEEENVKRVVTGLVNSLERASIDYELVLVNNGSIDNSPQILEDLAKEKPDRMKVVHVSVNQGYGWGIINGLKIASGEYVGYMGGDGQIKPEDVIRVYYAISQGNCDLAKVKRISRKDGLLRKMVSLVYNRLFRLLFRVTSLDINGTPKIFRKDWLERFQLTAKDWFIDSEVMIKANYLNLKVSEVLVEFLRREKGRSHVEFTTILEFAKNMFNYRLGRGIKEWKQRTLRS